jgi:hypothetical protein
MMRTSLSPLCGLVLPLLLVAAAAAPVYSQEQQQQEFLTYEDPYVNPLFALKVSYPKDWEVTDTANGVEFDCPGDDCVAKFTLSAEPISIPPEFSTNEEAANYLVDYKVDIFRDEFADFRLLEINSTATLGGLPAEKAVFSITIPTSDFGSRTPYTNAVILVVKDSTLYMVFYGGQSAEYDRLLPTFERMVQSVGIQ